MKLFLTSAGPGEFKQFEDKIKYILIDFGGTFFTYGTSIATAKISDILGVPEKMVESVLKSNLSTLAKDYRIGEISAKTFWGNVRRELGIDLKMAKRLEYIWHSSFKPNKGMISLIKKLRKEYKLFVISGNTPDRVKYLNKKYHVNKLFDGFFFSFDCGVTKPEPKFLKIALKKLGAKPEQCLLIDDSREFSGMAERLGVKSIVFKDAERLTKDLKRLGIL